MIDRERAFAQSIYRGNRLQRRNTWMLLGRMAWIFDCPECEYNLACETREGAETIRSVHVRTAHPARIVDNNWQESPLSEWHL